MSSATFASRFPGKPVAKFSSRFATRFQRNRVKFPRNPATKFIRRPVAKKKKVVKKRAKEVGKKMMFENQCEPYIETVYNTQNKEFCVSRLVNNCKTDAHRYCKKFSNTFPFQNEKQNYQFKPEKRCQLEMKTCPKKAKKYSYTKDCKKQHREIRDHCKKKSSKPYEQEDTSQRTRLSAPRRSTPWF